MPTSKTKTEMLQSIMEDKSCWLIADSLMQLTHRKSCPFVEYIQKSNLLTVPVGSKPPAGYMPCPHCDEKVKSNSFDSRTGRKYGNKAPRNVQNVRAPGAPDGKGSRNLKNAQRGPKDWTRYPAPRNPETQNPKTKNTTTSREQMFKDMEKSAARHPKK